MAEIRKVYPDMFDQLYPGLLETLDSRRSEQEWRRIFYPGWSTPEEHVGYALASRGRLVAFLGLLYSEVHVGKSPARLCNVTSWIAEEGYQSESISLLLPIRKALGYTFTNMSGEHHVREIFRRFGFSTLEESTTIFRPPFSVRGFRRQEGIRLVSNPELIGASLGDREAQIFSDHSPYAYHLLAQSDVGPDCYCIYTIRRRRGLRTALFHHMAEPETFVFALPNLRAFLFRRHGAVIAECDTRFLQGIEAPSSHTIPREFPRLFKSDSLRAEQVPNTYSEVVLLDLE